MVNSRELGRLRDDVERNVRIFLRLCEEQGLRVLVTQTLRDDEYQESLYARGRTAPGKIVTNSRTTTFHGDGLAFDICQNIRGQEYNDAAFFLNCAAIAKHMGFSWGGDWKSFQDRPHFQWDERGRYQWSRTKKPKSMPTYEEEEMTQEQFDKMMDDYLARRGKQAVSGALKAEFEAAKKAGITDGSSPNGFCTRAQAAVMIRRATKEGE